MEISEALFREARAYASRHDLSFRQVIEAGLRRVLEEGEKRRMPFRLKDGSFRGRGMAAEADWKAIRRMTYEGRGE